ncbi:MAG TPA: lipocalin-like domain-containing protein [Opitutaceae bacterium]|nr:lipocalin-like domain-containing protein [Opitutaceae bacterium]
MIYRTIRNSRKGAKAQNSKSFAVFASLRLCASFLRALSDLRVQKHRRSWKIVSLGLCFCASLFRNSATDAPGFALPQLNHHFEFPRDHGSHPEFKLEWWYVTGHLYTDDNHRYGFQATFFRSAAPRDLLTPNAIEENEDFGTGQVYLAHMALLDVRNGRFLHQERLNREGWDATATLNKLDVRNGPWSLRMTDANTQQLKLQGSIRADVSFSLILEPEKPLVVFGQNGVSRKGATPAAASYYLTFPRLRVTGQLLDGKETRIVHGLAWMDHEISSSQLDPQQVGWDWACLQLSESRELMCYKMRRADGTEDPFSTLAWIDSQGVVTHVRADQFKWETLGTWTSPITKAIYPVRIRLTALDPSTGKDRVFILDPLAENQELTGNVGGIPYWEGGCHVRDEQGNEIGSSFLELTGYAGKLRL